VAFFFFEAAEDFRSRRSPILGPIAGAVVKWMATGKLQKVDEWEITLELWALARGYLTSYRAGRFDISVRARCLNSASAPQI